jgi:hypothetical protein
MYYSNIHQHSGNRRSAYFPKLDAKTALSAVEPEDPASKRLSRFIVNNPVAEYLQNERAKVQLTLPTAEEINRQNESKIIGHDIWDTISLYTPTFSRIFRFFCFYLAGVLFYQNVEHWSFQDTIYFITMSFSTVGYGNIFPVTKIGQIFTFFYLYGGILLVFSIFGSVLHSFVMLMRSNYKRPIKLNKVQVFVRSIINAGMWLVILFSIPILGAIFFAYNENWEFETALYFAITTATSTGYGDIQVEKSSSVWFNCVFIVVSVSLTAVALDKIASFRRHLYEAELWQILDDIEPSKPLLDAINSKETRATQAEYILHMLQLEGKLDYLTDIARWKEKFDEFDLDKDGVLTMNDCTNYSKVVKRRKGNITSRQQKKKSLFFEVASEVKAVLLETIGVKKPNAHTTIDDEVNHDSFGSPIVRAKALKRASAIDNNAKPEKTDQKRDLKDEVEEEDIESHGVPTNSFRYSVGRIFQGSPLFSSASGAIETPEKNKNNSGNSTRSGKASRIKRLGKHKNIHRPNITPAKEDQEVNKSRESTKRESQKLTALPPPPPPPFPSPNRSSVPRSPTKSTGNSPSSSSAPRPKSKNYKTLEMDIEL